MLILNCTDDSRGWSPIQHMVALASELFDAQVVVVEDKHPSRSTKALSFLQKKALRLSRPEPCLLICAGPSDLTKILNVQDWRSRFGPLAAWIIDSFWTEHIPKSISLANIFDQLFVTSMEDVDVWRRVSGVPTTWLPWGSDALRLGSAAARREWDITRVGRQPPEWDDDQSAAESAAIFGIKYRPRPASHGLNTLQNHRLMMDVYANTKYVLAFSNAANPESYTHPTRQYLTGRWVDGLAGGAILAGIPPSGAGVRPLLWEGATLNLGTIALDQGLKSLSRAMPLWTPCMAANNHVMALRHLDWRWRFKVLAESFGLNPIPLATELISLSARISELVAQGAASCP